jgi:serine/threonine-protein kinase
VSSSPPSDRFPDLPNLRIVAEIGRDPAGVLYEAVQTSLDRAVAVKVLLPGGTDDPSFHERLDRESKALARLQHPNIVRVHGHGVHEGPLTWSWSGSAAPPFGISWPAVS